MASNFRSAVFQSSDLIYDFVCSPCKDDGLNNEAQFFCDECKKYYGNTCVRLHNKLFRTHSVLGRQEVSRWLGYAGLSPMETCDKHSDRKLELLCEDHNELCCHICVSLTHRMCKSIKHIPDLADGLKKQIDFRELPADVDKIITRLEETIKNRTHSKRSLNDSGGKILAEIKSLRKRVNDQLDEIEKQTNVLLQDQLHKAGDLLQEDIYKCTQLHDKINTYLKSIQSKQDDNTFIAYKKCKKKMREAERLLQQMQELSVNADQTLKMQIDSRIEQLIFGMNTLGEISLNYGLKIKNGTKFKVKMQGDKNGCLINGICELPGGELLITDLENYNVKLLDTEYQVIAKRDLTAQPQQVCHIAGNETALTLRDKSVHFVTATGGKLSESRKLTFKHECLGISHHNDYLYVGSCTAIYQYTLSCQLVKRLYEDNTSYFTVYRFTLSRDGTKIYIPAPYKDKLITIDKSGNILSVLQDPDFNWPIAACVDDSGLLFVCSSSSHKVTQVDKEGKHKLTTLATKADGLREPCAVWFTKHTHKIIVGGLRNEISVFELE